jgi:hypothetical protein
MGFIMVLQDTEAILEQIKQKIPENLFAENEKTIVAKEIMILAEVLIDAYSFTVQDGKYEGNSLHSRFNEGTG